MTLYDRKNGNIIRKQTGCVKQDFRKDEISGWPLAKLSEIP